MDKPIQVVCIIWFHLVIGSKSTFSYWLLVRYLSQQVDCSYSFTHAPQPSIPSLNKHRWVNFFLYFESLWLLFLQPARENSTFKGLTWLSQVLQVKKPPYFKTNWLEILITSAIFLHNNLCITILLNNQEGGIFRLKHL